MLLKRSIVLAAGVLLFILAYIIYFEVTRAQMEEVFHQERVKYGVEGAVLTAPATVAPAPAPPTAATLTNAPATPESTPAPATTPASPATNAAPATAPASTMNYPRENRSPFFVLTSYQPNDGMSVQYRTENPPVPTTIAPTVGDSRIAVTDVVVTQSLTNADNPPATNAAISVVTPSAATNAAPIAPAPVASPVTQPAVGEASVIVLLYHQFKPAGVTIPPKFRWTMNQDVFESEMKYIHDNGYHVVPLSDVLRFIKHEITLPPGSVAITIDDGYKSAIVYAAPILKKYGYPWTFFIYPEFITVGEGPGAASWNDLLALQAEGIDIESHSMTHPQLTRHRQLIKKVMHDLTPEEYAAWLNNETGGSKALLEQKLGKPITCFAYPFGDYNKQVEASAIAAGYEAIFTVADNPVHSTTSLHSIGRYTITREEEKNFPAYLRQSAMSLTKADPEPGATVSNPRPVITAVLAPMGAAKIDPKSIETSVRDFGEVRHDFDPATNTLRLYLPRDLIQQVNLVNIRGKDAATGQILVANWHFNYEPGPNAIHPPIPVVKSPNAASTNASASKPAASAPAKALTNAPAATEPGPTEKSAEGTPLGIPKTTPD